MKINQLYAALIVVILLTACGGSTNQQVATEEIVEETASGLGEEVSYSTETTKMNGYIAYDKNRSGKKPGILVIHEWWGHNEYVRSRADQLAELGYVALAVDMYGDGQTAEHPDDAGKFAGQVFSNIEEAKARFNSALELLRSHPEVDPELLGAIGYCFGGTVALNMANAGSDLKAIAVFHAGLNFPIQPSEEGIKPEILVCNGAADTFVTGEQIEAFKTMMDAAGARYSFINYEEAVHGFTNPGADAFGTKFSLPLAYQAEADEASWKEMKKLFTRAFN